MNLLKQLFKPLATGLILIVRFYQKALSPLFPSTCRYRPTCSDYAIQSLKKHGPFLGTWYAFYRILRCNPWGGHGHDPVP